MKLAIFILCHHKPWLIRSSLLSLFSQKDNHNYDLHFIMIKGNGEDKSNKKYSEYFLNKMKTGEKNPQLSDFDTNVLKEIKKIKIKYYIHNFKNDHGLDSGAWIKLVKSSIWKKYDYSLLLMEGFLFSSNQVLETLRKFLKLKKPDFISSGHEKRFYILEQEKIYNETNFNFYQYSTNKIWINLLKIKPIGKLFKKSKNYLIRNNKKVRRIITEHHISNYPINFFDKIKLIIKSIIFSNHIYKKNKSVLVTTNMKKFIDIKEITKNKYNFGEVVYHEEKNPFFFGCSCQHVFSKKMFLDTSIFFKKNKIYQLSQLPYFGQVFEILWGALPLILKKKKWFFNGLHRVRKNLINYSREDDDIKNFAKYLNFYNCGSGIKFFIKNNDIKYKIISKKKLLISKLIK